MANVTCLTSGVRETAGNSDGYNVPGALLLTLPVAACEYSFDSLPETSCREAAMASRNDSSSEIRGVAVVVEG